MGIGLLSHSIDRTFTCSRGFDIRLGLIFGGLIFDERISNFSNHRIFEGSLITLDENLFFIVMLLVINLIVNG